MAHYAGDNARDDQILERIDGQRFERVNLLGDAHSTEFRANAGAHAAGNQKPGNQRAGFLYQSEGEGRRYHRFGPESFERGPCVHGENGAYRKARKNNQRSGSPPDLEDLFQDFGELKRPAEQLTNDLARKQAEPAKPLQRLFRAGHHFT